MLRRKYKHPGSADFLCQADVVILKGWTKPISADTGRDAGVGGRLVNVLYPGCWSGMDGSIRRSSST